MEQRKTAVFSLPDALLLCTLWNHYTSENKVLPVPFAAVWLLSVRVAFGPQNGFWWWLFGCFIFLTASYKSFQSFPNKMYCLQKAFCSKSFTIQHLLVFWGTIVRFAFC